MFSKILSFELKYWLKSPLLYTYAILMMIISMVVMAIAAGVFDSSTVTVTGISKINSAKGITGLLGAMSVFVYFLLPSIVGSSIYKDYKYDMHQVLFAYPFGKFSYLFGKFVSSFMMVLVVILFCMLGLWAGTLLPGVNQELLLEFKLLNYLQPFLVIIIPNLLVFGAIVFGVVTFSRNIFVGFITVVILLVIQGLANSYMQDLDTKHIAALLNPTGGSALAMETEYWTVAEENSKLLPFKNYVLYNRLLWLGISALIFTIVFSLFKFHQQGMSLNLFKKKGNRVTKQNFGVTSRVPMPSFQVDFSFFNQLKIAWKHSFMELKYILKNWAFISITVVAILLTWLVLEQGLPIQGTNTLPVTKNIIQLTQAGLSLFIMILIFLFSGMLLHRGRISYMDQLVDASPVSSWVMQFSKFLAIVFMSYILYALMIIIGITFQATKGFYDFEVPLYFFDFYVIFSWNWVIYTFLAFFFHSLIKNYIVGFISLLALTILLGFFPTFGIEQSIFNFNEISGVSYSDMNGYGSGLELFFVYKLYWGLFGIALYVVALLFYRRGIYASVKERFAQVKSQSTLLNQTVLYLSLIGFFSIGGYIYYVNNIENERLSGNERELRAVEFEKTYGQFSGIAQPRIVSTKINMDLYPETRDIKVEGVYGLVNKSEVEIDSLHLNLYPSPIEYSFNRKHQVVLKDTVYNYHIIQFDEALQPGDSVEFTFNMHNKPNTLLQNNSPVVANGTFINNSVFPGIGYNERAELSNNTVREKYELPPKERMKSPLDSVNLKNNYISSDADWIDFETTISTSPEQIAIAPGYLQKEWEEDGRRYFHYKMDNKILNFYNFMSAEYEVVEEDFNGIKLQIFYHKGHDYNLDRMLEGAKKGLTYYEANFSPYQFRQLRIIEFPSVFGTFAQAFANTVPFSESIGFIADVNDEDEGVDYPFSVTAHEVAHQWWAHQVIGANVRGATVMSESLSEYSSLKVLEKTNGADQMRRFLKDALDQYLSARKFESAKELPLILNEQQQYIHYRKGSMVMYAMSDYLGEANFNAALSTYIDKVAFQEPPYTTAIEFKEHINMNTPDSLKYLITDMFETITLYDNKIVKAETEETESGQHKVSFTAQVLKYRNDEKGNKIYDEFYGPTLTEEVENEDEDEDGLKSLFLADYIDVGIYAEEEIDGEKVEKLVYLKKHKIEDILNDFEIEVDLKPTKVGIDPLNKLIDRNSDDNRKSL
jgi:ABC-2 type transport system permease protein